MAIKSLAIPLVILLGLSTPSYAQCDLRDRVLERLADKYSEAPVAYGVTNAGGLVEVLQSSPGSKADTWTIIVTTPQGISCFVAAGEGWTTVLQVSLDPET